MVDQDACQLTGTGVWDAIDHGDIEEQEDSLALSAIYQEVPMDVLFMMAEKDSAKTAWETLQIMHVRAERVKEAKA